MNEDRVTIGAEQAISLFHAQQERRDEIYRRGLHLLMEPDPAELPPWPPCPACGTGVESWFAGMYSQPNPTAPGLTLHLDVEPCGHRLTASGCSMDVFDA